MLEARHMNHLKHSDVSEQIGRTPCNHRLALQAFHQAALRGDPNLMKRDALHCWELCVLLHLALSILELPNLVAHSVQ